MDAQQRETDETIIARIVEDMMSDKVNSTINQETEETLPPDILMQLPAPATALVDSIRDLLKRDKRLLRSCIIIENMEQENRIQDVKTGEVVVSFVYQDAHKLPRFLNFTMAEDDIRTVGDLYEVITFLDQALQKAIDSGAINSLAGTQTGGGENMVT